MVWLFLPLAWEGSRTWLFSSRGCGWRGQTGRFRVSARAWSYVHYKLSTRYTAGAFRWSLLLQLFLCRSAYEECTQLRETWICTEVSVCFHFWSTGNKRLWPRHILKQAHMSDCYNLQTCCFFLRTEWKRKEMWICLFGGLVIVCRKKPLWGSCMLKGI